MDWGIVASVILAMTLFMAAIAVVVLITIGLFVWRIKKHLRKHGNIAFEFPECCLKKSAQTGQN